MMPHRPSLPPSTTSQDGSYWAIAVTVLLAVIAAGSATKLIGLDHLPIWHDEVFTLVRVFGYPSEAWNTLFSGQLLTPQEVLRFQQLDPAFGWSDTLSALAEHPEHAPLYYVLGRFATMLPLDPVTALRGTAAVFGVLLPLAAFWLMRALFGRGPSAWIAAALIAVSPMHLLYAQEARQYALWTLLVLAASAALLRALRGNRPGDWWLYAGLLTLGLYSHLLFALVLPVHAAYGWLVGSAASGSLLRPTGLPIRRWLVAVAVAVVLFLPWIIVFLFGIDSAANHTEWMERAIGAQRNLLSWGRHITRAFLDVSPAQEPPPTTLALLLPVAAAVGFYLWRAPRPQRWLLVLLVLVYLGIVLGPDLLLGGSRSLHVRYGLPAILGIQLMVAWSIGSALQRGPGARIVGVACLALLLLFGLWSQWRIQQAERWWSKQYSADNIDVARIVNVFERPLVAVSPSGVAEGELISLAYHLDEHVRIWSQSGTGDAVSLPAGFDGIVMLLPSAELRNAVGPDHHIEPIGDSWQWFLARPNTSPKADDGTPSAAGVPTP